MRTAPFTLWLTFLCTCVLAGPFSRPVDYDAMARFTVAHVFKATQCADTPGTMNPDDLKRAYDRIMLYYIGPTSPGILSFIQYLVREKCRREDYNVDVQRVLEQIYAALNEEIVESLAKEFRKKAGVSSFLSKRISNFQQTLYFFMTKPSIATFRNEAATNARPNYISNPLLVWKTRRAEFLNSLTFDRYMATKDWQDRRKGYSDPQKPTAPAEIKVDNKNPLMAAMHWIFQMQGVGNTDATAQCKSLIPTLTSTVAQHTTFLRKVLLFVHPDKITPSLAARPPMLSSINSDVGLMADNSLREKDTLHASIAPAMEYYRVLSLNDIFHRSMKQWRVDMQAHSIGLEGYFLKCLEEWKIEKIRDWDLEY